MKANGSFENQVVNAYRKRAGLYDISAKLYCLIRYPYTGYRKRLVRALGLRAGDTVVDIGCGTGLNFPLLQREIGPTGKIIGVDLTDAMLAKARQRVQAAGWSNVELVHSDATEYQFPDRVDGILSTYVLCLIPSCEEVITNGSRALSPGRRLAVLDLKLPSNPVVSYLWKTINRPFAVTEEVIERRPWDATEAAMRQHLENTRMDEFYLGTTFLISGESAAQS